MTSIPRLVGEAIANQSVAIKLDAIKGKAQCSEKHGWKKGAKGCERRKASMKQGFKDMGQETAQAIATVAKENKTAIGVGAGLAALGGTALALPLIELDQINGSGKNEGGVIIPPEGLSAERLENYNKQFTKGDLVRNKFILPTGTVGYHYGVYAGKDEKTGDPQILHLNPVSSKTKKGVGVVITSMEPRPGAGARIYEYEKAPIGKKVAQVNIDQQIEKLQPYIGKTVDFNIFDKNCEAFARAVVGEEAKSLQTGKMSKIARSIGRTVYGVPITVAAAQGQRNEVALKGITGALNGQIADAKTNKIQRRDSYRLSSPGSDIDWSVFLEKRGEGYQIISPMKALAIAETFKDSLEDLKVSYLKGYFLFLAASEYTAAQGG
jgi:hypothetical protein